MIVEMLNRALLSAAYIFSAIAQTVPVVDTNKYLGRWYQVYSDLFVEATFENSSYCVTADYGLYPNKTISVENRERVGSIDGPVRRILGWANTNPTGFMNSVLRRIMEVYMNTVWSRTLSNSHSLCLHEILRLLRRHGKMVS
jgi:lipocalin